MHWERVWIAIYSTLVSLLFTLISLTSVPVSLLEGYGMVFACIRAVRLLLRACENPSNSKILRALASEHSSDFCGNSSKGQILFELNGTIR